MTTHITILGTGTMASGIAAGFIAENCTVAVLGRSNEKSESCLKRSIDLAAAINKVNQTASTEPAVPTRLASDNTPPGHLWGCFDDWHHWGATDLVIETVTENLALKQALFAMMDQRVPANVPIGSNSSGFPITKIAGALPTADRMLGIHYFMPAEIVPLVEIVLGQKTRHEIAQSVYDLYKQLNKKPVLVKRDIPGFLANRIQHALMREALSLIDAGIASPDDVDDAVRYSFGFRYAAVGPMTQKEISGWDGMANAAKEIYPSLSNIAKIPPSLSALMDAGKTGMKAGEGYRKWSAQEISETRARYNTRLKAALAVLQMD